MKMAAKIALLVETSGEYGRGILRGRERCSLDKDIDRVQGGLVSIVFLQSDLDGLQAFDYVHGDCLRLGLNGGKRRDARRV